jgi:hypothetical protein
MKTWNRFVAAGLTALSGTSLIGCGGAAPPLPTVPVKLAVTVNGKPIEGNVNLRLLPEPANEKVTVVVGKKMSDGTFGLETFRPGDGAPPGTYKVEFGQVDTTDLGAAIPQIKPATVIIPNQGGEVSIDLKGTGKVQQGGLLPPPT